MSEAGRGATFTGTGYLGDRRAIAGKAAASILFAIPGYLLGGLFVVVAGVEERPDVFGVLLLALAISFVASYALERAVTGQRPRILRDSKARPYDARIGVSSLLLCFTLPAVGRAAGAYEQMPAMAAWGVVGIIWAVVTVIEFGPPLLRPHGFEEFRSRGTPPPIVAGAVITLFALALVGWIVASSLVDAAGVGVTLRELEAEYGEFPSMTWVMPVAGWVALSMVAVTGVAFWWFAYSKGLYASATTAFVVLLFWSEGVWRSIRSDFVGDVPPTLLVAQIVAGAALIATMVVGYIFRRLPDEDPAMGDASAARSAPTPVVLENR